MPHTVYKPLDREVHPPARCAPYRSTVLRAPAQPLVALPQTLSERTGPRFGSDTIGTLDADLTRNARRNGEPLGERIIVTGRVLDEDGQPQPGALVEIWQTNAAGRYVHLGEVHDAPLDPNFLGAGRCLTDDDGRYRFVTIKPGAYPWGNHHNAWRPAHVHFSVCGPNLMTRLVTQMFFPGDPLLELDPIFNAVPGAEARALLVARFSIELTEPEWALGYEFDIVLRGQTRAEAGR